MSRNYYFLVARDRDTNEFKVIPTSDTYGSSLEKIDLFTIGFDSEQQLAKKLVCDKKMDHEDLDLFIAFQKKEKGNRHLYLKEVLYSSCRSIRDIAEASDNGDIESKRENITSILHEFCRRMKHNQSFYDTVMYGKTDLFKKFKDYFSDRRYVDSYDIKYRNGGWVLKSYPLIRGIIELFYSQNGKAKDQSFPNDQSFRKLLEEDLLRVTDPNYDPNQLNFLSFLGEDPLEKALIANGLLDEKEVNKDGYEKRKTGEGTN